MKTIKKVLSDIEDLLKVQKKSINSSYMAGLYNGLEIARCCITNEEVKLCENPDKSFISHIKSHLKKDEKVICKICNKPASNFFGIIEEFINWFHARGKFYSKLPVKFYTDGEPYFSSQGAEFSLRDYLRMRNSKK